jgi:hypothetical protein
VVFNEISFAPAPGEIAFVEIKNSAPTNVPLFDTSYPTNTWRIDGLGFAFPPSTTLAPGGLALVASSDPALFRRRYGIPDAVPVFGPFSGTLQRGGERLELQRPDAPDAVTNENGVIAGYFVPYLQVDLVRFKDSSPWPTNGIGTGSSIERRNPTQYGNDPANWRSRDQAPSPGAESDGNRAPRVTAGTSQTLAASNYPVPVTLNGSASDDGLPTGNLTYQWSQSGGAPGVVFENPNSLSTVAQLPGQGTFTLKLTVSDGQLSTSDELTVSVSRPGNEVTVIPFGSTWHYFDLRQDLGTNWRTAAYVESADWKSGAARLGYGGDGEVTVINTDASPNRIPTAYFRKKVIIDDPARFLSLTVQLVRDDGAAVYVNGREVFRSNLPEGELLFTTWAVNTIGGADEQAHFDQDIPASALRVGENLFAVEVHQQNGSSSDLAFDLALIGVSQASNQAPTADAGPSLSVQLPETAALNGKFTDDGLPAAPGVPAFSWSVVNGPGTVVFSRPNELQTQASFTAPGIYQLRLTVHDGTLAGSSVVEVSVKPANSTGGPPLVISRTATNGTLAMEFKAESGRSYSLQQSANLTGGDWAKAQEIPPGAARTVIVPIPVGEAAQFFRLFPSAGP